MPLGLKAIEVIEDVVAGAPGRPSPVTSWGRPPKYLLRAWHKGNTVQDLQKAMVI